MIDEIGRWNTVNISTVEFEVLWEEMDLGPLPHVLDLPSPGDTHSARAVIVERARTALRGYGLYDDRGPHEELARILRALVRFRWAVDLRAHVGRRLRARGVGIGPLGVVVGIDGDRVIMYSTPEQSVVGEMVNIIGDVAPMARESGFSLRASAVDIAERAAMNAPPETRGTALSDELVNLGESSSAARSLARVSMGVVSRGQLSVYVGTDRGEALPARRVVAFHDNQQGRIMHLRKGDWITFVPADGARLRGAVNELISETERHLDR